MIKYPLVSIVIPVYNREKIILETINSAKNQTYPNFEIILVDNNSTDNTWQIIKEESKNSNIIKSYQNKKNVGPVRNWKKCFEYAQGDYIKILWSDDLIDKDFLKETIQIFEDHIAFVMSGVIIFSNTIEVLWKSKFQNAPYYTTKDYLDQVLYQNQIEFPVSPGCAIFRKKDLIDNLLIEIPNEDSLIFENLGAGNDLLLFLLTANNKNYTHIACIDKHSSMFRSHENSISIIEDNVIKIYYAWSKLYFIKNYYNDIKLKKQFKSKAVVLVSQSKSKTNLLNEIEGSMDILTLTKEIINGPLANLSKRIKNKLRELIL